MNTHFAVASHILVALHASTLRLGGKPLPTAALSWSAKTHNVFILRIVKKLETAGLVETVRGPKGGIKLKKPGGEITLADVYLATQDVQNVYKIHDTNEKCEIGNNVFDALTSLQLGLDKAMLEELSKKNIAQLAEETLEIAAIKINEGAKYTNYKEDLGLKH